MEVILRDNLRIPANFCAISCGMKAFQVETSAVWYYRAKSRRHAVDQYLWKEEKGIYSDCGTVKWKQTGYESATIFCAMWAGLATPQQAAALVIKALPKSEAFGGLDSEMGESRGPINLERPWRQWDYPFGTVKCYVKMAVL